MTTPDHPTPASPLRRRDLLSWLSAAATGALLPALPGCGGGDAGAPPPDDGGSGSGPGISDAARARALADCEAFCHGLPASDDPLARAQAVAAWFASQPLYASSGVEPDSATAWGTFTDQRVHLVSFAFVPTRLAAAASAARAEAPVRAMASPVELPRDATAVVLHSFGVGYATQETVGMIGQWLADNGYAVAPVAEGDARLTVLRSAVQGPGFFYLNTHGGAGGDLYHQGSRQPMFSVQSSSLVSAGSDGLPENRDDLANARLTYFTAPNGWTLKLPDGTEVEQVDTRYGITAAFVRQYWRFSPDAVVVLNACSSARSGAAWADAFVAACHAAGAGVYFGWSSPVSPLGADGAPRYLVDRMLGANAWLPEPVKQRAFPWPAVMADMGRRNLLLDTTTGARFLARPAGATTQILVPGIHHVEVDESQGWLTLYGDFGTVRGEVTVDFAPLRNVVSWAADRIVVEIPTTGAGSFGRVQVSLGSRQSNLRALTLWTPRLDVTYQDGRPTLQVTGSTVLRHRADIGRVRERPGDTPTWPVRFTDAAQDVALPLVAGGAHADLEGNCTSTWSGRMTYPSTASPQAGEHVLWASLRVEPATREGWYGLALGAPGPDFTESGCGTGAKFAATLGLMDGPKDFDRTVNGTTVTIPLPSLHVTYDVNFRIVARTYRDEMNVIAMDTAGAQTAPQSSWAV